MCDNMYPLNIHLKLHSTLMREFAMELLELTILNIENTKPFGSEDEHILSIWNLKGIDQ
jgi:hypothetical protein